VGGNGHDLILNYIQRFNREGKEITKITRTVGARSLIRTELSKYKLKALPLEPVCSVEQERERDKKGKKIKSEK
jgi:hypothetical protein